MRSLTLAPILLALLPALSAAPTPDAILCTESSPPTGYVGYAFTFMPTLNYAFLLSQPTTVAQICNNAGELVSHALGASVAGSAAGWRIIPVATSSDLGYTPAAVVITGPEGELDELNKQLGNSTAALWSPPDAVPRELAGQIDESFPVVLED